MEVYVKQESIFIPEWEGNKDQPSDKQIKWKHTFLTTTQRRQFFYVRPMRVRQLTTAQEMMDQEDEPGAIAAVEDREIVQDLEGVSKVIDKGIENLTVVFEDGTKKNIETMHDFYDAPDAFPLLRAEIESYVLSLSARTDLKN